MVKPEESVNGICKLDSNNFAYATLFAIQILISSIGLLFNLLLVFTIIRSRFFPKNVSLLLANMTVALMFYSALSIIRNLSELRIISGVLSVFNLMMCTSGSIQEALFAVTIVSMVSLGLDRWMMTRKLEQNIHQGTAGKRAATKVKVLITGMWVLAITCGLIIGGNKWFQIWTTSSDIHAYMSSSNISNSSTTSAICACPVMLADRKLFIRLIIIITPYLFLEILIVCLYLKTWYVNKQKMAEFNINSHSHSLEARFEIRQNIRTTVMMLPTVLAHGICLIVNVSGVYLTPLLTNQLQQDSVDHLNDQVFNSLVQIPLELYSLLHPLIAFGSSKQLRSILCGYKKNIEVSQQSQRMYDDNVEVNKTMMNRKAVTLPPNGNIDKSRGAVQLHSVRPEEGVEIMEKIWNQKSRGQAGPSNHKKTTTGEPWVEIDLVWENGLPKRHRRPEVRQSDGESPMGLSFFIGKFQSEKAENKSRAQKYQVTRGMPEID